MCQQRTGNVAELMRDAAAVKPAYDKLLKEIVGRAGLAPGALHLPRTLKKAQRVVEKTSMVWGERRGRCDRVCDVVRSMITVSSMAAVVRVLNALVGDTDVRIVRFKDRFLSAPSAGGWRDLMLNFVLLSDETRHVMECQIVLEKMLMARKGLDGHAVYNRVRNASELLEYLAAEEAEALTHIMDEARAEAILQEKRSLKMEK